MLTPNGTSFGAGLIAKEYEKMGGPVTWFGKPHPSIYKFALNKIPEIESKKLMDFCELPWDKKCLEFYKRKDLISKTASNVQIREAIYKHSLEKYSPYKKLLNEYGKKYYVSNYFK